MVKLKGQLLSLDAAGSLGKTMTYSNWKGRAYMKKFTNPVQPNTQAQVGIKEMMSFLAKEWSALSSAAKNSWNELANDSSVSQFDAYVSENLKRYAIRLTPTQAWPADQLIAPTAAIVAPPTAYERYVELQVATFGPSNPWGIVIYADQVSGFFAGPHNVIKVVQPITPLATLTLRWEPATKGNWYLRWAPFSVDGVSVLDASEESVVW